MTSMAFFILEIVFLPFSLPRFLSGQMDSGEWEEIEDKKTPELSE